MYKHVADRVDFSRFGDTSGQPIQPASGANRAPSARCLCILVSALWRCRTARYRQRCLGQVRPDVHQFGA